MAHYAIRTARPEEFEAWYALYHPYSVLMGDEVNREIATTVWTWIHDPNNPTEAIVATAGDEWAGFAQFRPFARTLHGNQACFLDDVYVSDNHRNSGLGKQLIETVCAIAGKRGWSHVRWVTGEDNIGAQRLYNRIAKRIDILTYHRPAG